MRGNGAESQEYPTVLHITSSRSRGSGIRGKGRGGTGVDRDTQSSMSDVGFLTFKHTNWTKITNTIVEIRIPCLE